MLLTASKIAEPHHREVNSESELRLDVLIGFAQRRHVARVEVVEPLLRVRSLLLGELELSLVEEAECGRRKLACLLDALRANGKCRVHQLGRGFGIVADEGDADEARPQGLDAEALADVVDVSVLVGRIVESGLERSSSDHVDEEAPRLKELL